MAERYDIVVLGLALSSSWGNGHATTWRALIKGLANRGHRVLFLEREQPWYAAHRDLATARHCALEFYDSVDDLAARYTRAVRDAAAVIVGSYVPDGIAVGRWACATARGVRAFYDIDTPVTLAQLARGECAYLERSLVREFDVYLSFTGGPTLARLEHEFGARCARALYCSVDPDAYHPLSVLRGTDLGYLGTYSADRQPGLERLLVEPARRLPEWRFVVVGAQYPASLKWPDNVERVAHLAPPAHARFYGSQRFTLNLTRSDMVKAGYSPSVRLFEAAACAVPVISDRWPGIETFFEPGREILLVSDADEVSSILQGVDERRRRDIGMAAYTRVLAAHTSECRAAELEEFIGLSPATTIAARPPRRHAQTAAFVGVPE